MRKDKIKKLNDMQLPRVVRAFALMEQRDLAKVLNVSKALVSRWENGERKINPEHRKYLTSFLLINP